MNNNSTASRKDDPLSTLYQISEDFHPHQQEAIQIITSILDDIEKASTLRDTLNDIIIKDEVMGLNILNRLETLIKGVKKEHQKRLNREWHRRFITAYSHLRI